MKISSGISKKKILVIALIVLCIAICTGGTLAYYSTTGKAENVITTGGVHVKLLENGEEVEGISDTMDAIPSTTYEKVTTVKNTGNATCWIRVKIEKSIAQLDGTPIENGGEVILLDLNTENWTEQDGFYYYNEAVEPEAVTEILFSNVTFDSNMGNKFMNTNASINVDAQAVQVDNNGESALEAEGWPGETVGSSEESSESSEESL